ncbi:MAG: IS66 family insertion sequence element accessory protein TnpB [Rhodobacteraceae bacterium]|nr:IS66 family insertion sequence element accessory protein TnpB [Paracoccaceae bacterium]
MSLFSDIETLYLHRDVVDFRKSINGLVVIVEQDMQLSPFSDTLFVFTNKARDKLKIWFCRK